MSVSGRPLAYGVAALTVAFLGACENPLTQIVVVVDSDVEDWERVEVEVSGFEEPRTVAIDLAEKPLPRRFSIVHAGGPLGPISIEARAFASGDATPRLVEPRRELFFVRDETRLLRVDLLEECIGACAPGEACLAGPRCVAADEAGVLEPWRGDLGVLDPTGPSAGGGPPTADGGPDAGPAGQDGGDDGATPDVDASGTVLAGTGFPYLPSNFEPHAAALRALATSELVVDCGTTSFDSESLAFSGLCDPAEPSVEVIEQLDGSEVAVIAVSGFTVDSGSTFELLGTRPVIVAVWGDASVAGTVDASASAASFGPGALASCTDGAGSTGAAASSYSGGGGGSGGGFGNAGGAGGSTGLTSTRVDGGGPEGNPQLVPLRGGCAGGNGGTGGQGSVVGAGGGGGGAVQVSAAGTLSIAGTIVAAGGGGLAGDGVRDGGGGGGSGGGILLEGSPVQLDDGALVVANGGGGSAGQAAASTSSTSGSDGGAMLSAASGGSASGSGGDGGDGGAHDAAAGNGQNPVQILIDFGGGGGGGGGVGRIRVNGAESCTPAGSFSPLPSVSCDGCGPCRIAPEPDCVAETHDTTTYFLCPSATDWDAASRMCANAQLHLAHVDGADEDAWIESFVGGDAWIGGNDLAAEGDWRWIDDDAALAEGYDGWAGSEPSGGFLDEDCLTTEPDGWHDQVCAASYPYLCESD